MGSSPTRPTCVRESSCRVSTAAPRAEPHTRRCLEDSHQFVTEARKIAAVLAEVWGGNEKELLRAIETKVDDAELAALQDDLVDLDLDL